MPNSQAVEAGADRLVQIAMDAALGGHVAEGEEIPGDFIDMEAAVKAVEPFIRKDEQERIREALEAVAREVEERGHAQQNRDSVRPLYAEAAAIREAVEEVLDSEDMANISERTESEEKPAITPDPEQVEEGQPAFDSEAENEPVGLVEGDDGITITFDHLEAIATFAAMGAVAESAPPGSPGRPLLTARDKLGAALHKGGEGK